MAEGRGSSVYVSFKAHRALMEEVDRIARELGVSRSHLIRVALANLVSMYRDGSLRPVALIVALAPGEHPSPGQPLHPETPFKRAAAKE